MKKQIKDLKAGEFFTLKDYGENDVPERAVWVRGEYDKGSRTYSCCKYADANHEHFSKARRKFLWNFIFRRAKHEYGTSKESG